jgi:hypothetical protein
LKGSALANWRFEFLKESTDTFTGKSTAGTTVRSLFHQVLAKELATALEHGHNNG